MCVCVYIHGAVSYILEIISVALLVFVFLLHRCA